MVSELPCGQEQNGGVCLCLCLCAASYPRETVALRACSRAVVVVVVVVIAKSILMSFVGPSVHHLLFTSTMAPLIEDAVKSDGHGPPKSGNGSNVPPKPKRQKVQSNLLPEPVSAPASLAPVAAQKPETQTSPVDPPETQTQPHEAKAAAAAPARTARAKKDAKGMGTVPGSKITLGKKRFDLGDGDIFENGNDGSEFCQYMEAVLSNSYNVDSEQFSYSVVKIVKSASRVVRHAFSKRLSVPLDAIGALRIAVKGQG